MLFILIVILGLKREIQNLNSTIEIQSDTLEMMKNRIAENEKAGNIYQTLFTDLPDAVDKYNATIQKTKDSVIGELDRANQTKDENLKQVAQLRLKEIDIVQPIVNELSTLNNDLHQVIVEIQSQLRSLENISQMTSTTLAYNPSLGSQMAELEVEVASHTKVTPRGKQGKSSGSGGSGGSGRSKSSVPEPVIYEAKLVSPADRLEGEKKTSEQPV
ncbi:MAG: hypothetical protein J2P41_05900 [Blastocatellia bacterium]|nr:hypothetical protein [Blastocatellia bacterium]